VKLADIVVADDGLGANNLAVNSAATPSGIADQTVHRERDVPDCVGRRGHIGDSSAEQRVTVRQDIDVSERCRLERGRAVRKEPEFRRGHIRRRSTPSPPRPGAGAIRHDVSSSALKTSEPTVSSSRLLRFAPVDSVQRSSPAREN
jgi:hypothetical protein